MTTRSRITSIPYVDIAGEHAAIKDELLHAMARVIDHSQFVLGPEVEEFERRFAALCGVRFAVGVNSGTDALTLALQALGVGPGDEVITVPNSFVSSTACIVHVGAQPVFVDAGEDYNINVELIEQAITPRTKAILPVHLTGRPAEMDTILRLASAYGVYVGEDAAQAVTAEYRGRRVGSFGSVACFSCHPLKTLNACGDAGVLTTDDEAVEERLRMLRNVGLRTRDEAAFWGANSRLDTLQAAVLLVKMEYTDRWTERRRANAAFYRRALADLPAERFQVPQERSHERAVYHTFVVKADRRNELQRYLAEHGVGTAVHYPVPIHLQPAAVGLGHKRGDFPVAERQAESILSLPVYWSMSEEQLQHVADTIRAFYRP